MILFVAGGTASGKSAYAEKRAAALHRQAVREGFPDPLIYAATLSDQSEASLARIRRHQAQRRAYPYQTQECFSIRHLRDLTDQSSGKTVLLDCLSGLVANVLFSGADGKEAAMQLPELLQELGRTCRNLIIVSDLVFSDGIHYDAETETYIELLGICCRAAAAAADQAVEVVCGIPVITKGMNE